MTNRPKILLVEDDPNLGLVIQDSLQMEKFDVTLSKNGEAGYDDFLKHKFDLCLLDIMLPKKDGFSLAKEIRQINNDVPIIFLTAKSLKEDKIEGFKIGCDDYITKPFSVEELVLRIQAVLRRSNPTVHNQESHIFEIGTFQFEYERNVLVHKKNEQKLTTKESELLRLLCLHRNKVLDRQVALKLIWGNDSFFMSRSMDVYITKLRKFFKEDESVHIQNVHGLGFKLVVVGKSE